MRVSRKVRFMTATIVWFSVAVMLIVRGLFPHFAHIESTSTKVIALTLAIVIGTAKGIFVLSKSTARTAAFIAKRPERDLIWMSFHPVLYLLIPLMILLGRFLRKTYAVSHPEIIVCVYVGIGLALLVAIRGFRKIIR